MEKNILKIFGFCLRDIRLKQKLSQEELALKANLDRTYISGVERGVRNISLININKIAKALNLSLSELFIELSKNEKGNK